MGQPPATRVTVALRAPISPPPVETPTPEPWNLDADIGALLVVSTRGGEIGPVMRSLLTDGKVGGVLLFGSNFGSSREGMRLWSDRLIALAASARRVLP